MLDNFCKCGCGKIPKKPESKYCQGHNMLGYHRSDEIKKKLSIIHLGHYVSDKTRKKISIALSGYKHSEKTRKKIKEHHVGNRGKHASEETLKRMSEAQKKRESFEESRKKISESIKREKNPNWKGGITPENRKIRAGIDFRLWREAVFARDNWRCQECGKRGDRLHPHHIKFFSKYPELRFAIDNGITLCIECHKKIHKQIKGNRRIIKE